jgi:hypothetical protein
MEDKTLDEVFAETDYKTKLAVTAWVFEHILAHGQSGGSFRYLIYDRLGFGVDAYVPLCLAGGIEISNEFDMQQMDAIKQEVIKHKIDVLKPVIGLCDEPECFGEATCGFPIDDGYRRTCYSHSKFSKE